MCTSSTEGTFCSWHMYATGWHARMQGLFEGALLDAPRMCGSLLGNTSGRNSSRWSADKHNFWFLLESTYSFWQQFLSLVNMLLNCTLRTFVKFFTSKQFGHFSAYLIWEQIHPAKCAGMWKQAFCSLRASRASQIVLMLSWCWSSYVYCKRSSLGTTGGLW